jgi:hypothetical protein
LALLLPFACHFERQQYNRGLGMGNMRRWQAKLPDWRLALAWLVLTFVAAIIFFFPMTRLMDAFAE